MTEVGVFEPYRQVYRKQKTKKTVDRNQPVGCKASTEVCNVEPLGHVCCRKEREEILAEREKTCRLQSQNGVDYGGPLRAGTVKEEEKGSSGNGRWDGEPERGR